MFFTTRTRIYIIYSIQAYHTRSSIHEYSGATLNTIENKDSRRDFEHERTLGELQEPLTSSNAHITGKIPLRILRMTGNMDSLQTRI